MMSKFFLASNSPRRSELLRQISAGFTVLKIAPGADLVDETPLQKENASDYCRRMASSKADAAFAYLNRLSMSPKAVLTADTTVTLNGAILGKPTSPFEAEEMLLKLAGNTHEVITAVAVKTEKVFLKADSTSLVTFAPLKKSDIARMIESNEPFDKAGGYAVQGLAARHISRIVGSYSGIMGLPLFETAQLLTEAGLL